MEKLLHNLQQQFPKLRFSPGKHFCWSPQTQEIFYKNSGSKHADWSLLHETGHAVLSHTSYQGDFELLRLEVAAWQKARELARNLSIEISEDHIQDCLDTYRDWLYKRSICPTCSTKCLQQSNYSDYRCFNCHTIWHVTPSLFSRSYRSTKKTSRKSAIFV